MQAVIDLAPVAAFVVAYYLAGIYVATAVLMLAMLLLLLIDLVRLRRVPPLHWISAGLVFVLGGATLILRDARFLKWKPTIFLWLVALTAIVSVWFGRKKPPPRPSPTAPAPPPRRRDPPPAA